MGVREWELLFSGVSVSETRRIFHDQSFEAFLEKDSINYIKIPQSIKLLCMLEILQMVLTSKNTLYLFAKYQRHISNLSWMAYVSHCNENDKVITFWK